MAAIIWLCLREVVCVCVCVCACVCAVNTQGICKAKNVVLGSAQKIACRLPVYRVPLKYSIALINTKPDDLSLM
jgi:hypothetical protein